MFDANVLIQYVIDGVTLAAILGLGVSVKKGISLAIGAPIKEFQHDHELNNQSRKKQEEDEVDIAELQQHDEEVHKSLKGLGERLDADEEHLDKDNKRLTSLEESSHLILKGVMQLITHEIDGNHVDKLKDVRDNIQEYLIDRT